MHCDKAAAVAEYRLYLDHRNEISDPIHDIILGEDLSGVLGDVLDGLARACAVQRSGRNDRDSLGVVELETLRLPLQRHFRHHIDKELVELSWSELHPPSPTRSRRQVPFDR